MEYQNNLTEDKILETGTPSKKRGRKFKFLIFLVFLFIIGIYFFYWYLANKPKDEGNVQNISSKENKEYIAGLVDKLKIDFELPARLDEFTTTIDITAEDNSIKYHYIISEGVFNDDDKDVITNNLVYDTCYDSFSKEILNQNIDLIYSYIEQNTGKNFVFNVKADDCLSIYTYVSQDILDKYTKEINSNLEIYNDYCKKEPLVLIYDLFEEVSDSEKQKNLDYRNNLNKLSNDVLEEKIRSTEFYDEIGEYLEALGVRYLREDNYKDGFNLLQCASINYGDKIAMVRLAKSYGFDDFATGIEKDDKKSYFWILNSLYLDIYEGSQNNIIASSLGLLDSIQGLIYGDVEAEYHEIEEDVAYMVNLRHPEKTREEIYDDIISHYGSFSFE
ncbi:MAG: hypothetical protein ACD_18C00314G0026 [uncultured bacterium]|nr:MAG: hypothetical protein ACD_18C00314G0026 [uncultured bacterium]OGH83302.1 MAG: hypothetical protein A2488_02485 [Candidatus Magasanikbacteria bacterium RIFOXYC12_FULL_32_21b]OGH89620.1 MAG: hypothetical protein A2507_02525 [Candidatus Magasanikbacteria bacterium RIFOXYD12_FULL_33_17]HAO51890.1 hypothetical protein [Candidatus Magasanikbacteria bacterium]